MSNNKIEKINEIKSFLEGKNNDLKYIVNIEAENTNNYATCIVHEPNQPAKQVNYQYQPFLYIKDFKKLGLKIYGGDGNLVKTNMIKYGISITKLKTGNQKRLEDGFCYKVTSTKSSQAIIDFFKDGGLYPYETEKDAVGKVKRDLVTGKPFYKYRNLFFSVKPAEQFLISTSSRLFKGIEEYNQLQKVTFDIETTGLRYEITRVFAIGVRHNHGYEKVLEVDVDDNDDAERKLIIEFFNLINQLKSAVIMGYNSEKFDFEFILGRARILGIDIEKIKTTLNSKKPIQRIPNSTVKLGNMTEKYTSTTMWGYSIIDILHAVKKTAAINTDIKNSRLKYICKHEGIAKPDRMYIIGDDGGIGKMWRRNMIHLICKENNQYCEIPEQYQVVGRDMIRLQSIKDLVLENKENLNKEVEIEKCNEVRKKILNSNPDFVNWYKQISNDVKYDKFIEGKDILRRYLLDDLWETEQVDNLYNQSSFLLTKLIPTTFSRVATMGTAAIWNLLLTAWSYENDLAIPESDVQERFSGGLARCFKTGYSKRIVKIDYASLYPMLQLTYGIFPIFDITNVIEKMLSYMTTTRNIYKKLAGSDELNSDEIELMKEIDHDTYNKYINGTLTDEERAMFKVKQLPIKILNNSLFGALGSGISFNWSDNICAARITCSGRLKLRHAISYFKRFGCDPLLAVTDGINFAIPDTTTIRVDENGIYYNQPEDTIENMWKFKNSEGISALINKYNAEEMVGYLSVDNDGEFISCLNLSRINYGLLYNKKDKKTGEVSKKVKLTGNTIKSKTMPEYIEEFIDNGLKMILEGEGEQFINYYNDYAENLYYQRIPLKKIASKSKVKKKLIEYLNRGLNKNGKPKGKQAHMELLLIEREANARKIFEEKYDQLDITNKKPINEYSFEEILKYIDVYMPPEPELDSIVYYVNTGEKKGDGDSAFMKTQDGGERFCSILINSKDLEENPNLCGNYNVDKYLSAFNKRVMVLLEGFKSELRDKLLVSIKKTKIKDEFGNKKTTQTLNKNVFDSKDLKLQNFESDNYDESMIMEKKEVEFWNKSGYNPYKVWNGFKTTEEDRILYEYYEHALNYLNNLMIKSNKPLIKKIDDQWSINDLVLLKNNNIFSLGKYNGVYIEIIRDNVDIPKSNLQLELEAIEAKKQIELDEKKNAINLFKESIQNKNQIIEDNTNDMFERFKKNYKIPSHYTIEFVRDNVMEFDNIFQTFIDQIENEDSDDYDLDDAD